MRLRHYLRGLGLGIIVSTLVISAGGKGNAAELSDEEIKTKARALGMVEEDELLLSEAKNLAKEAAAQEPGEIEAMSPLSENAVSGQSVSAPLAIPSVSADSSVSASEVSENGTVEENIPGSLKGAGAESAINGEVVENNNEKNTGSSNTAKSPLNTNTGNREETLSDAGKASNSAVNTGTTGNNTAESKPAETKPAETKPAETKPAETKPAETKPAETKPAETKPAETNPAGDNSKPAENTASSPGQGTTGAAVTINIVKGESSTAVAKKLQQAGLVTNAAQFDSYLCLNGYDRRLVTGSHQIPAGSSAREVAELITSKGI